MNATEALQSLLASQGSDCTIGCDLTAVPTGEGYMERPCVQNTPFFAKWCKTYNQGKGYPAGSFVYDDCGMYFNLEHETRSPRDAKSVWVQFTGLAFALMFAQFLKNQACPPTVEPGSGSQVSGTGCVTGTCDTPDGTDDGGLD